MNRCLEHLQSIPCTGCIADSKARDDEVALTHQAAPVIDPEQQDVNDRGIRWVRAALERRTS